jgi:DNA end-binding protein Ku
MASAKKPSTGTPVPRASKKLTIGFGDLASVQIGYGPFADESRKKIKGKLVCPIHGIPGIQYRYLCSGGTPDEHVLEKKPASGYPNPDKPDEYVLVDKSVLDEIAESNDGTIQVKSYVPLDSIDSTYLDQTFLVWPEPTSAFNEETFDLFAAVFKEDKVAAVATVVLGGQTVQVILNWSDAQETVVLRACLFESQIRRESINLVKQGVANRGHEFSDAHFDLVRQVMALRPGEFDAGEIDDTYTPMLEDAIRASAGGREYVPTQDPVTAAAEPATDLLASLRESVAKAKAGDKKPAAKKPAAKSRAKAPA